MTRILSTGTLLLVLAGIAWSFPGCSDDEPSVDARSVDTSAQQQDAPDNSWFDADTDAPTTVDTTASLPDAAPDAS